MGFESKALLGGLLMTGKIKYINNPFSDVHG